MMETELLLISWDGQNWKKKKRIFIKISKKTNKIKNQLKNGFKPLGLQVNLYLGKCMCKYSTELSAAGKAIFVPSIIHPIWLSFLPLTHIGTSLLQEVVYLVSQGADPDEIGLMNIDEQLPVLEYPQPGLEIIQVNSLSHMHIFTKTMAFSMRMLTSDLFDWWTAVLFCVSVGTDITSSDQKPPAVPFPPHSDAQWRRQGQL